MTFEELKVGRTYLLHWSEGSLGIVNIILDKNDIFADVIQEESGRYSLGKTFEYDDPDDGDDYTYFEDITEGYIKSMDFNKLEIFKLLFKGKWI